MKQPWHSQYQVVTANGVAWSNPRLTLEEAKASKAFAERVFARKQRCVQLSIVCTVHGINP